MLVERKSTANSDGEQKCELLHRLKARDPGAIGELYARFGTLVLAVISRIVHDRAVAEDLVQETFLRAWNRVDQLSADYESPGPWLLTIARRCAYDHLRSVPTAHQVDLRAESAAFATASIDCEIETNDRIRRIEAALALLDAHQRKVIELAYYDGLSQTAIAERLNMPLGTVKAWTRAALKRLRKDEGIGQYAPDCPLAPECA